MTRGAAAFPRARESLAAPALWVLVAAVIFLLPGAFNRWVFPKETVALAGVLLAAIAIPAGRLPRWVWIAAGTGLVVAASAALLGATPLAQIVGRWPRYEGLISVGVYFAVAWAAARLLGPAGTAQRFQSLYTSLATASVLLGVVSLLEASGARPIATDLARPGALLGNATEQGIVGVMLTALLVLPAIDGWSSRLSPWHARRWLFTAGITLGVATVVVSASRAALLGLLVVFLALVAILLVRPPAAVSRLRLAVGLGGAALVAAGAAFAVPLTRDRILSLSPLSSSSVDDRFAIWSDAITLFTRHPWLGVGPNGYLDAVGAVHEATWFANVGSGTTIDSPHSIPLQLLLVGGIPLLVVAVVAVLLTFRATVRVLRAPEREVAEGRRGASTTALRASVSYDATRRSAVVGATLALSVWGVALLTHFSSPGTAILAALAWGVVVAIRPTTGEGLVGGRVAAERPVVRRLRIGALAVWLVLSSVWTVADVHLNTGVASASSLRIADADAAFTSAAALRPWDVDVPSVAAQSFAEATEREVPGALPLALLWSEKALQAVPTSVLAGKARAVALQYSGDIDGAIELLTALRKQTPNDPEVAHRLGGMLLLASDQDGARVQLEFAASRNPDSVDVWLTLQYLYEVMGDAAAADRATKELARLGADAG
ncbi:O-antigen ligase [Glaciihabitans tibetensis]|uniref:O-antigen ligase n=1 Tax=Glaciihabitans tibetensis TaxID=1266600 RepID=A0A2T0VBS3_9MICO|nr:O-antigen ligase family protein [Glaciihabitans tibetensis]PRY67611.1 O-antigen ligase [Glaciihabitans tibetensis]